jgi:nicotinamide-nucleotide amidase
MIDNIVADEIDQLALQLGESALKKSRMICTAESCTGGWLAQAITSVAGSSQWFERGFITYTNIAKHEMLKVDQATLDTFGAVSEETVIEMTAGALMHSHADAAVAVSGIAGPSGGSEEKPVGMVCFAWQLKAEQAISQIQYFTGDRQQVRAQAVIYALQGLATLLQDV